MAALALLALAADPSLAQAPAAAPAEPTVNKGDTAWMLAATFLVLLMTIPGLALFYGGLVREKNALSVLMHVFYCVCIVVVIWMLYGYSLAFTGGSRLHRRLLQGVPDRRHAELEGGDLHASGSPFRNTSTSRSR